MCRVYVQVDNGPWNAYTGCPQPVQHMLFKTRYTHDLCGSRSDTRQVREIRQAPFAFLSCVGPLNGEPDMACVSGRVQPTHCRRGWAHEGVPHVLGRFPNAFIRPGLAMAHHRHSIVIPSFRQIPLSGALAPAAGAAPNGECGWRAPEVQGGRRT